MTWLIIGVILLAAFGPVLWLLPSPRDRHLSALRQQARKEGLVVELRRLPKLDAAPEERVSAGGKLREPLVECMAYSHVLGRRLQMLGAWRVLRYDQEPDEKIPQGWIIDPVMRAARPEVDRVREWLQPLLSALPEDVVALEFTGSAVGAYWLENASASVATVTELGSLLAKFGEQMRVLDADLQDEDS